MWLEGFITALSGHNVVWLIFGTLVGLVVGILPAVGPSFGVALALPFTFGLDPASALIFLAAIQAACAYGDSIASILLNIPGGPGTVATCWDGHPLARRGKAGTALGISTAASFSGGVLSWLSLVLLAGLITKFALSIGPPEYFALGVLALGLISLASKGETIKGLAMSCLGLALGCIGSDPVTGTTFRYTFGLSALEPGIEEVIAALAIFAVPQIIEMLAEGGSIAQVVEIKDSVLNGVWETVRRPITLLRSGIVGWFVGIMPAFGTSMAGITSYLIEKKYSRESAQFGQGAPAGLVAAEVGKGACVMGDCIPAFMLGVPGSVTTAILMAALVVHGIQPGPRFLTSGVLPYTVFSGLLLGQLAYFLLGLVLVRYLARLVRVPNSLLAPILAVLVFLGAYVVKNYVPDIAIMLALAGIAFWANKTGFPTVCLILGFLLGPIIETNFHRALGVGFGSYMVFITRPISAAILAITAVALLWPYIWWIIKALRQKQTMALQEPERAASFTFAGLGLLILMSVVFIAFIWVGQGYKASVRLFPSLVSWGGLMLCIYQIIGVLRQGNLAPLRIQWPALADGKIPWQYGFALLLGFLGLIPVLGLVAASVVLLFGVAWLTGYRRWLVVGASGLAVVAFLLVFPEVLGVSLPTGPWGW